MTQIATKRGHRPDYFLLAAIVILVIFGLAMLASASSNLGKVKFNDTYYYLKHQMLYGLTLGAAGFAVGYVLHYQIWKKFAFVLLLLGIVSLVLVFTPLGATKSGEARSASRWIQIGPLTLQPAEFMKLAFLVYLAAWLSNPRLKRATDFQSGLVPFLIVSGLIAALLIFQPATSTIVILLISALTVYFMSGAPLKYILLIGAIGLAALALIIYLTPYRLNRVIGFLNTSADTQGLNYQAEQARVAIGSGEIVGRGYGQSVTKTNYLPGPMDDSIFAVIAEELGFVGAAFLVALFALYASRLLWLAKKIGDRFGRLLLIGFGTVVAVQAFVNMAAISGVIPLTGVPLPFVSYGGTALAAFLTMGGISLNVSKYA